jgi:hypothetical protein
MTEVEKIKAFAKSEMGIALNQSQIEMIDTWVRGGNTGISDTTASRALRLYRTSIGKIDGSR